jgi:hypothetical protein
METGMWQIQWKDNERHSAGSIDEVNSLLDAVHQENAHSGRLVQIANESGETLMVGLGNPMSVLTYAPAEGWPSKSSRNAEAIDNGEAIGFFMGSHWSEMPKNYAVPVEQAREAVTYFCERGELSPSIEWIDD